MSLKEHEDNQYTKEKDEVEKYLLRIIQRYFDIENNYTKESIEAIIVESLTRLKQIVIKEKGFLFSLNQKTGHLVLSIKDFGGEFAFDKNTAYNKDFGDKSDTICEGNDIRLDDRREPLDHVHEIADVKELAKLLKEYTGMPQQNHRHQNQKVLDMLTYSGTQVQIDLIVLDFLADALKDYIKVLTYHKDEIKTIHENSMTKLNDYYKMLQEELKNIKDILQSSALWLEKAKEYADNEIKQFKTDTQKTLLKYLTDTQMQQLTAILKKSLRLIADGEFPINNGTIEFTSVEVESSISADSQEGDSLFAIYNEGLRIGVDDWDWDTTKNSFVFQSNTNYAMFASLNAFEIYTHRATLKSNDEDDDTISVVLAYDATTGYFIAVHCVLNTSQPRASLCIGKNSSKTVHTIQHYTMNEQSYVTSWNGDTTKGWWALNNGVTILVKRNKNDFNVWINFNEPNTWNPVTIGEMKDIPSPGTPAFTFNVDDIPETYRSAFKDKANNYGYACESQRLSTYEDIFFTGVISYGEEKIGYSNANEVNEIHHSISSSTMSGVNNGSIKLFFRYDEDGKEVTTALPFTFTCKNGERVVIKGTCTDDGNIDIHCNLLDKVPFYIEDKNFYTQDNVIVVFHEKVLYDNIADTLEAKGASLCVIENAAKFNFVKSLIIEGKEYYINGCNGDPMDITAPYYDYHGNEITFLDWDAGQPVLSFANYLIINENGKMATSDVSKKYPYVAEYKLKRLNQYFDNPRIYYQVLGNEEVS